MFCYWGWNKEHSHNSFSSSLLLFSINLWSSLLVICSYSILQSNKRGRPQSGMVPTNRPTDTLSVSLFHSADIPKNLTANKFNNHFLSVAEFLAKPRSDVVYHSDCSNILHEFCERKTRGQMPFVIPYISSPKLGKHISKMDNKIWTRWH